MCTRKRVWSRFYQSRTCTETCTHTPLNNHFLISICEIVFFLFRFVSFLYTSSILTFGSRKQIHNRKHRMGFFFGRNYNKSIIIIELTSFGVIVAVDVIWTNGIRWQERRDSKKKWFPYFAFERRRTNIRVEGNMFLSLARSLTLSFSIIFERLPESELKRIYLIWTYVNFT